CPLFETTKFVGCAFLIRKVCNVRFFEYKVFCRVRFFEYKVLSAFLITKFVVFAFLRLQRFVRFAFLIKKGCSVHFLRPQKFVVCFSEVL
ncbi:hypothetical protein K443DRAFT_106799, partial [Laccaria amethystina LaAM-08-1]